MLLLNNWTIFGISGECHAQCSCKADVPVNQTATDLLGGAWLASCHRVLCLGGLAVTFISSFRLRCMSPSYQTYKAFELLSCLSTQELNAVVDVTAGCQLKSKHCILAPLNLICYALVGTVWLAMLTRLHVMVSSAYHGLVCYMIFRSVCHQWLTTCASLTNPGCHL